MCSQSQLAAAFLLLVPGALIAWIVIAFRRSPYTLRQSLAYFPTLLLTRLLWRTEVPPRLPLEPGQGAVLICNHRCSIDPFFIQIVAGQVVHWMVAREYFEMPFVGALLKICGSIPVNRGGIDTAATKAAVRLASQGELVGMLPEGRINMTDEFMLPARPGAVMVALRSGAPIVPCYIEGAPYRGTTFSPFYTPAHVRVRFGQPMDLAGRVGTNPDERLVPELMLECLQAIADLAGQHDFQPKLAGRRWKPTKDELSSLVKNAQRRGAAPRS